MNRLRDKVAIITGGASGIGAEVGRLFIEQGAYVLLVDSDSKALEETRKSIESSRLACYSANVSNPGEVEAYTQAAIERFGGVDIAVLNAGITGPISPIDDYPIEEFDRVISVNLRGVWLGVKSAAKEMKKRGGGSIVITSSCQGLTAISNTSGYTCSKHAVVGLMRGAALEYARNKIRVNTENPGFVETPMVNRCHDMLVPGNPEMGKEIFCKMTPMRHYGQPLEVANMIAVSCQRRSELLLWHDICCRWCHAGLFHCDTRLSFYLPETMHPSHSAEYHGYELTPPR